MRTTTKDNIKYTYPDANVWKQERILVNVERQSGSATAVKIWSTALSLGTITSPLATYSLDSNGKAVIDITDIVRTYIGSVEKVIAIAVSTATSAISSAVSMGYKVVGLINPANVIIPPHDDGILIAPPRKMISPDGVFSASLCFEFYSNYAESFDIDEYVNGATAYSSSLPNGSHFLDDSTIDKIYIVADDGKYGITRNIVPSQCGREYALVEWKSFTGNTRRHVFEVVKAKSEIADSFSLMSVDNEYIEIKGRKDGLTLRLDGLSAYDLWYYSDLITSSNVLVSFDGIKSYRVQVTTKSFTIPDGEAVDGELEININWKRYDAVAM